MHIYFLEIDYHKLTIYIQYIFFVSQELLQFEETSNFQVSNKV